LETVLRRDRAVIAVALFVLVALTWAYLIWLAANTEMGGMDMPELPMMPIRAPWQPIEFLFVFAMWAVMMLAMMTPSAAPMILIYARVGRQAASERKPFASTSWFAGGYLLTWVAFALAATLTQWAVERSEWLTPRMAATSAVFGGFVLVAAGLYQWTPIKNACLRQCQAPLQFIQRHGGFRGDPIGSLSLGVRHGGYCVGCCWALMALLFVGGVMNLLWIAVLMILVLLEKVVPAGRLISRVSGIGFLVAGIWLIARSV
jgi:predicted metal-binding membrane protein